MVWRSLEVNKDDDERLRVAHSDGSNRRSQWEGTVNPHTTEGSNPSPATRGDEPKDFYSLSLQ